MTRVMWTVVLCMVFAGMAAPAFAAEEGAKAATPGDEAVKTALAYAMGGAIAVAAAVGALSQARAITASVEAMARQPEAGGRIFGAMVLGLALIETLVIYALLICIFLNGHWPK